MKISHNWLQEYLKDPLPIPDELARVLTMHVFEVEGIDDFDGDHILDIDVLPNRTHDCLSYLGIAREVAVLTENTLNTPEVSFDADHSVSSKDSLTLKVEDGELVRRAMKRLAIDVKVDESPKWLVEKLAKHGQRSINNIVDLTNFVMLETGQPVHAFDFDKIAGKDRKEIVIRRAKDGEKIKTLDGKEYELTPEVLVIADNDPQTGHGKPLDIAGIKGGADSGIDENTTRIVLSICNFHPTQIRRASRNILNLMTDASKRFEQEISPVLAGQAMERLSQLVSEVSGGKIASDVLDVYPNPSSPHEIKVTAEEVNKLLGTNISEEKIGGILKRLDFEYTIDTSGSETCFVVTVPLERLDLMPAGEDELTSGTTADLIEEIGRFYGYENITVEIPEGGWNAEINKEFYYINKIRDMLISEGFSEVQTYAFQNEGEVEVANPIAADKRFLRSSVKDGLTNSFESNSRNEALLGVRSTRIFEIGTVFKKGGEYIELGIMSGKDSGVQYVLQKIEEMFSQKIEVSSEDAGKFLNLSKYIESLPEPESYDDLADIDTTEVKYKPISPYPFVLRDIAFWTADGASKDDVEEVIVNNAGEWLVRVDLFDEYKKDNRVSYAFHLVFQSLEKTLSDEEVNEVMAGIEKVIEEKDWEIR